jgi:hypothetical protein
LFRASLSLSLGYRNDKLKFIGTLRSNRRQKL